MLEQNYEMDNESYGACDTTTHSNINTPFSVKDILNISSESEYMNTYVQTKDNQGQFEGNYPYQYHPNWDNTYLAPYEHYNYNFHNFVEVKVENEMDRFENGVLYGNQHVQQLNNFCSGYQGTCKEIDYSKMESPSKLHFFVTRTMLVTICSNFCLQCMFNFHLINFFTCCTAFPNM